MNQQNDILGRKDDAADVKKSAAGHTNVSDTTIQETPKRIWILLSTLYEGGGAEIQAQMELRRRRRKGEIVYLLTFDPKLRKGESREPNHLNLTKPWYETQKRILENVDSPRLIAVTERKIEEILKEQGFQTGSNTCGRWPVSKQRGKQEDPKTTVQEVILHLHNITYGYTSICQALMRVRKLTSCPCVIYETVHDCRIICDKGTRLLPDGSFCTEK